MEEIDFSIIKESAEGEVTKEAFFNYSEEEKQENEINKANAKLVFSPKFIPVYPELLKNGLTLTEALIFGFIYFYKSSTKNRFYFTNKQIAEMINCSEETVSRTISRLLKLKLIKTGHKIKAGGGKIRFVNDILLFSELTKCSIPTCENVVENKNKINKNNINNNKTNNFLSNTDISLQTPAVSEYTSSARYKGTLIGEILNSIPIEWRRIFAVWLEYKKDRRESYKNLNSLKALYNKLLKLSNNDPDIAKKIIDESMSNNWAGLFPLKGGTGDGSGKSKFEKSLDAAKEFLRDSSIS